MRFVLHGFPLAYDRSDRLVQQPSPEVSCFASTSTGPHVLSLNTSPIEGGQIPCGMSGRPEAALPPGLRMYVGYGTRHMRQYQSLLRSFSILL